MTIADAVLRTETTHYLILANQLRASYGEIDEETLAETLEGLSELPDMIQAVVRSSLDDDALINGLKGRLADLQARLERLKDRYERKRELAKWAMEYAGIDRIQAPDLTASLRQGPPRLEILDETKVPDQYFVPLPPKLDKAALATALKGGEVIEGAHLLPGQLGLTVRVK